MAYKLIKVRLKVIRLKFIQDLGINQKIYLLPHFSFLPQNLAKCKKNTEKDLWISVWSVWHPNAG